MADLRINFESHADKVSAVLPFEVVVDCAKSLRPMGVWLAAISRSSHGAVNVVWSDQHPDVASIAAAVADHLRQLNWDADIASGLSSESRHEFDGYQFNIQPALDRHNGVYPLLVTVAFDDSSPQRLAAIGSLVHGRLVDAQAGRLLQSDVELLSAQLGETYEEVSLIYQLSSGMTVNKDPLTLLEEVSAEAIEVMNIRGMGVLLQVGTPGSDSFQIHGQTVIPAHLVARLGLDLNRVLREKLTSLLSNQLLQSEFDYIVPHARQMLAVPILRQDLLLGVLVAFDKIDGEFDTSDAKLLGSISGQTGVFLENTGLFNDLNSLVMGLLHSLTSAVDAKDAYTCGHSQRVALLARQIARQAKLPNHFCERVYMAGVLHDVGKIGVPESVLQKPGKLTFEEFEMMKAHVEIGAKILRDVKQVEDLVPGVRHHHERFDGRGYPDKLAGHDIPLVARLLCLADCFDAMTSNRTYRKALPIEIARMEIQRCSGTQFDPSLADAFMEIPIELIKDSINSVGESPKPEKPVTEEPIVLLAA